MPSDFQGMPGEPDKTVVISDATSPTPSSLAGARRFGDYELLDKIAHGGMGVIYKARQRSLNRVVALKMMLSGHLASEAEVKRFRVEAEAAATLNHPNIVGIHEVGCLDGQHFFSMEFIDGKSLAQMKFGQAGGAAAGREAAHLLARIARAVQYAHERGILHRDLKPANILVDARGEPHVLDFGLARRLNEDSTLTVDGAVLGTPSFIAPEQAAGKNRQLSAAADIYGLGALLYFVLTGRPPFAAQSVLDTLVQVLEGEVVVPRTVNPHVPRDLERICLRCLEKAPERRYPTAASLAEELDRFLKGEPVQARASGLNSLLINWVRRQPALVSRLAGLALCLAIAQTTYIFFPSVTLVQHIWIMSTLGLWLLLSILCQWALDNTRWSRSVPYIWSTVDAGCLTAFLWFDQSASSPLVASFLALVALSGLWFRPLVVAVSTLLAILGYSGLVLGVFVSAGQLDQVNWHIAFIVLALVTGASVAYQINRVRALSRANDWRTKT